MQTNSGEFYLYRFLHHGIERGKQEKKIFYFPMTLTLLNFTGGTIKDPTARLSLPRAVT
jgi:hypothetical protein